MFFLGHYEQFRIQTNGFRIQFKKRIEGMSNFVVIYSNFQKYYNDEDFIF